MPTVRKLPIILTLLSLAVVGTAQAQISPSLSGPALLDALVEDNKPATVLDYDEARHHVCPN